ncbi:MAG: hypothetical protein ACI4JN_04765 [Ruminococcus sp.]
MSKWRCEWCESLNNSEDAVCMVCGAERERTTADNAGVSSESAECKSRWRCEQCECFNDSGSEVCIVCGYKKGMSGNEKYAVISEENTEPTEPISKKYFNRCAFKGCTGEAAYGKTLCEYHINSLCPMCNERLKAPGMDYCLPCGMEFTKKNTSGMRKLNFALKIVCGALLSIFIVLVCLCCLL